MKKKLYLMVMLLALHISAMAMNYMQARDHALFLTDKMAYELNLSMDQYDAVYEINLDYMLAATPTGRIYGSAWKYRNADLEYVLFKWQYDIYRNTPYFYKPMTYSGGHWHFHIYVHYPHRDRFYFDRPSVFVSYRGEHARCHHNNKSYYKNRFPKHQTSSHFGMRDGIRNGSFGSRDVTPRPGNGSFGSRDATPRPGNGSSSSRDVTPRPGNGSFGSRDVTPRPGNGSFGSRDVTPRPGNGSFGSRNVTLRPGNGSSSSREVKPKGNSGGNNGANRGNSSFGGRR